MDYNIFLTKLKNARKAKKISMREIGETLGVKRGQICNIEKGRTPLRVEDYFKICERLEISPCALMLESSQKETEYVFEKLSLLSK